MVLSQWIDTCKERLVIARNPIVMIAQPPIQSTLTCSICLFSFAFFYFFSLITICQCKFDSLHILNGDIICCITVLKSFFFLGTLLELRCHEVSVYQWVFRDKYVCNAQDDGVMFIGHIFLRGCQSWSEQQIPLLAYFELYVGAVRCVIVRSFLVYGWHMKV